MERAACDSVSAFGGIVAVNSELDGATAEAICEIFTEVVIAPSVSDAAKAAFAKKKNLRLLVTGELPDPRRGGLAVKPITGGLLVQTRDNGAISEADLKVVTQRRPTEQELKDCLFAWTVARHVKSNAIVYAKGGATAGIGAGQMNRRDSSRIAAMKAAEAAEKYGWDASRTVGSAVASDAFFPLQTACSRRRRLAPRLSFSRADRFATRRLLLRPMPTTSRWSSPGCGISATKAVNRRRKLNGRRRAH